ncbi:MAG TPA: pilus assembly protein N-terminal domain-containing protein, partial [Pirellulales bacterium]|nr:pilus assembly protein N-terminal domain-containing protein [Pirellulales bacterium]
MFITLHGIALRVATRLTPWVAAAAMMAAVKTAPAQQIGPQPVVQRIQSANEKLNMIASTSRNLTLDHRVPRVEVNNPDIIEVRPLSPTDLQVYAKRAGV